MTAALLAAVLALASQASPLPPLPATPRRPVLDRIQGVEVKDDYRWLEDGASPEVQAWSAAQDARTRAWLARLPAAPAVRARVRELVATAPASYFRLRAAGGALFALKSAPPRQQPLLVALPPGGDPAAERAVVDPNALDPSGATAIDFYAPSPDGSLVAVSLSRNGTEDGTLHVYEAATGRERPDRIARVNGGTAGGSVAWDAGGAGLWYTRYPREGERPAADLPFHQQVWFHRLGAPESADAYALGKEYEEPRIAESVLQSSDDGRFTLCLVERGDGGDHEVWLRGPWGGFTRVAGTADGVFGGRFGPDGTLWLLSRQGAPRGKLLRLPLGDAAPPALAAALTVAEGSPDGAIERFEVTAGRVWIAEISGGPSRLRVLDLEGRPAAAPELPPLSAVGELRRVGPDQVAIESESWVAPPTWFRAGEDGRAERLGLSSASPVDFSDVEVVRDAATSADGTRIPMTILRRRGTPADGRAPAILYGYGGYGISLVPRWSPELRLWLDQGGVYAEANLRGGAEFGDAWHRAGARARKQTVFDDFAACARHLVEARITSPSRLAIRGASNGGLLMGAALTQHPDLARAVVAQVGIFDMLRVEQTPNGAFNVTEYGTVADPGELQALLAYSPYQHVADGTRYPAVLLTAGNRDPRVDAFHARKMAARLQAATGSRFPVLLRVSDLGHGIGSGLDEVAAEEGDVYAFILHELGVVWRPPRAPRPAVPTKPAVATPTAALPGFPGGEPAEPAGLTDPPVPGPATTSPAAAP